MRLKCGLKKLSAAQNKLNTEEADIDFLYLGISVRLNRATLFCIVSTNLYSDQNLRVGQF
jgi:hypothetical protein